MSQNGYTLLELIMVLAVITIVLSLILPQINGSLGVAKLNALDSEMKIIISTFKSYVTVSESNKDCTILETLNSSNSIEKTKLKEILKNYSDKYIVKVFFNNGSFENNDNMGYVTVSHKLEDIKKNTLRFGVKHYNLLSDSILLERTNMGDFSDIAFIYDVNNNNVVDEEIDLLVYCTFYKLNKAHNH